MPEHNGRHSSFALLLLDRQTWTQVRLTRREIDSRFHITNRRLLSINRINNVNREISPRKKLLKGAIEAASYCCCTADDGGAPWYALQGTIIGCGLLLKPRGAVPSTAQVSPDHSFQGFSSATVWSQQHAVSHRIAWHCPYFHNCTLFRLATAVTTACRGKSRQYPRKY